MTITVFESARSRFACPGPCTNPRFGNSFVRRWGKDRNCRSLVRSQTDWKRFKRRGTATGLNCARHRASMAERNRSRSTDPQALSRIQNTFCKPSIFCRCGTGSPRHGRIWLRRQDRCRERATAGCERRSSSSLSGADFLVMISSGFRTREFPKSLLTGATDGRLASFIPNSRTRELRPAASSGQST